MSHFPKIMKVLSRLPITCAKIAHNLMILFVRILFNKIEIPLKVFAALSYNWLCLRSPIVRGEVVGLPLQLMFSSYLLLSFIRQWQQKLDLWNHTFAVL